MEHGVLHKEPVEAILRAKYITAALYTDLQSDPKEVANRELLGKLTGARATPIPAYVIVEPDGTTVVDKRIGRVPIDAFIAFLKAP
jgi:hypothetical protein